MVTWDEISRIYEVYAHGAYIEFGRGMLDMIQLLRNDPDIQHMKLGISMNWLLIALPDYDLQDIHILWVEPNTYEIFVCPYPYRAPTATTIHFSEIVPKVKEYLDYLRGEKAKRNP